MNKAIPVLRIIGLAVTLLLVWGAQAGADDQVGIIFIPSETDADCLRNHQQFYVKIRARAATLDEDKWYWRRYFASVRSQISILDASDGEWKQVSCLGDPNVFQKEHGEDHQRIMIFNQPLLGPAPYVGGGIRLNLALVKAKLEDDNLTQPFFQVLASVTKIAGVSVPANADEYSETIMSGVESVLQFRDNVLEVSYSTVLERPQAGHYVIYKANNRAIDNEFINKVTTMVRDCTWADPTEATTKLISRVPAGFQREDLSMMLVEVTHTTHREDWFSLKELSKPYRDFVAQRALLAASRHKMPASPSGSPGPAFNQVANESQTTPLINQVKADPSYDALVRAVLASPNLIANDRLTILGEIDAQTQKMVSPPPTTGTSPGTEPTNEEAREVRR
ncbi:MAG: hypothetical protein AB7S38_33935 [Vulcanimicrobiota bacterium]